MTSPAKPVIAVRSAGMLVGIPLDRVVEVMRLGEVTRVQPSPPAVHGITSVRGDLITLLDLGLLMADSELESAASAVNVIIDFEPELIGLVVQEFVGVLDAVEHIEQDVPTHLSEARRVLFRSVVETDDELMMLLDLQAALELSQE